MPTKNFTWSTSTRAKGSVAVLGVDVFAVVMSMLLDFLNAGIGREGSTGTRGDDESLHHTVVGRGSIAKNRMNRMRLHQAGAIEALELDEHADTHQIAAKLLDELHASLEGATRGDEVVDHENVLA